MTGSGDSIREFEAWYEADMPRLFNYLSYRVRDRESAEDLTAAVCEKAMQLLHRYDPRQGDMAGWIFGIARNELLHYLRDHSRRLQEVSLDKLPDMQARGETVEQQVSRLTLTRMAIQRLGELSEDEQELIALRYGAGLNSNEIGRIVGLTPGNVRVKLHRALEQLRTMLISEEEVTNA